MPSNAWILALVLSVLLLPLASAWTADNFFLNYQINKQDIDVFDLNITLKNPTVQDITINDLSKLKTRYVNALGPGIDSIQVQIWKNVSHSLTRNNISTSCDPVQTWKCTDTVTGTYTVTWLEEESVPLDFPVTFKSGKSVKLNLIAHKKPTIGKTANDIFIGLDVSGQLYERADWVWWNTSWTYKEPLTVNITTNRVNYQIRINVTYNAHMVSDFSDLRIINVSENSSLSFWLEDYVPSSWATFYINGSWSSGSFVQAYIYYGNTTPVSTTSSGANTFIFFDDMNGNLNSWTTTTGCSLVASPKYAGNASAQIAGNGLKKTVSVGKIGYMLNISNAGGANDVWSGSTLTNYFLLGATAGTSTTNISALHVALGSYENTTGLLGNFWGRMVLVTGDSVTRAYQNDKLIYSRASNTTFDNIAFYRPSGANTFYVDNVFGAKFEDPEPTTSIGSEEVQSTPSPPTWSNNATNQAQLQNYSASRNYGFQITWTTNTSVNLYSNITGVNKIYNASSTPAVSNSSNVFWVNFTDIPAGTSQYYWTGTNASGTNTTSTWNFTINKNNGDVYVTRFFDCLYYQSIVYNGTCVVLGQKATAYINEADVLYKFYTNGVFTGNGNCTQSHAFPYDCGYSVSLGYYAVGIYDFVFNSTVGQNYTSDSDNVTMTITKAATSVSLYLNGTQTNKTYTVNQTANFTALSSIAGLIVNMSSNYPGFRTLGGTTSIVNTTNLFNSSLATYNLTGWTGGNENYSSSSTTYYFTITNVSTQILNTSYSANVIEGAENNLFFQVFVSGGETTADINATFYYNGTAYPASNKANFTGGIYRFNISLSKYVNSSSSSVVNETNSFYWSFASYNSNGNLLSTDVSATNLQVLHKIYLGNCTDGRSGMQTLKFYLYDEEALTTPVNGSIQANFGSVGYNSNYYQTRSYTFTFNNITNQSVCIYPSWASSYTLQSNAIVYYYAAGYDSRYYYFSPTMNNVSQNIFLYLLSTSSSQVTIINVYDTDGTAYENATVDVQRYYPATSSYVSVGQISTDFDGKGVIYLIPNTVYYRFIVKNSSGEVLKQFSSKVITCQPNDYTCPPYKVDLYLANAPTYQWLSYWNSNFACSNTTSSLTCTVVTTNGVMINTSLVVRNSTNNIICTSTAFTASATLVCGLGNTTGQSYQYYLSAYTTSGNNWILLYQNYLAWPSAAQAELGMNWGEWGIFILITLNIIFFLVGNWIPYVPNVLAIALNYGLYQIGILNISLEAMMSFIGIQVLVMWIMSKLR